MGVGERRGLRGLGDARGLVEHARQLLERRRRGLEQVVELRQLLHRREEPPQVQQERGEHADGHVVIEHAQAAVDQHDRGGGPPDELHSGAVRGRESLRPHVGAAVAIVEVLEDLLVAGLAPERVHRLNAAEALDEVDDHQRDRLAGGAVGLLGMTSEPAS